MKQHVQEPLSLKYVATRRRSQDEATKMGGGQIMQDFICQEKE